MWDSALPLLLGLDSLVAGLSLAPLLRTSRSRLTAAVAFGAADAGASLVGGVIAAPPRGLFTMAPGVPALFGLYLLVVGAVAALGLEHANRLGRASALPITITLALALSVDNLAAGDGAPAVASGLSSAAFVLLALYAGGRFLESKPATRRIVWTGAGLIATACLSVVA